MTSPLGQEIHIRLCSSAEVSGNVGYYLSGKRLRVEWQAVISELRLSPELHSAAIFPYASLTPILERKVQPSEYAQLTVDSHHAAASAYFLLPACAPKETQRFELDLGDAEPDELLKAQECLELLKPLQSTDSQLTFSFTSDDVRVACRMAVAAYQDDPSGSLLKDGDEWPSRVHSLPLLVQCGERSPASPWPPYVLAITRAIGASKDEDGVLRPHEERTVWVAFRGTHNYEDVLKDLTIIQSRIDLGWVHSGYLSLIEKIGGQLNRISTELRSANLSVQAGQMHLRVVFTGHSMGGALAQVALLHQLAAGSLMGQEHEQVGAIAFGSPWVANQKVAATLTKMRWSARLLTVLDEHDIVPNLLDYAETAKTVSASVSGVLPAARDLCHVVGGLLAASGQMHAGAAVQGAGAVLLEAVPKAVTTITAALQRFGEKYAPYAPLGRFLILEQHPHLKSLSCRLLQHSDDILQWSKSKAAQAGGEGKSLDEVRDGILAHSCRNYQFSVDHCKDLLVPNAALITVSSGRFEFADAPRSFLLPVVNSCRVLLRSNCIRVLVGGDNLQFLNLGHSHFFCWDLLPLPFAGAIKVESVDNSLLCLMISIKNAQALSHHSLPFVHIHLRSYFCHPVAGQLSDKELASSPAYIHWKVDKSNKEQYDDSDLNTAIEEGALASLSVDMLQMAVLRLYFQLCSELVSLQGELGSLEQRVSQAMGLSPTVRIFQELCAGLPSTAKGRDSMTKVFNDALYSALCRQLTDKQEEEKDGTPNSGCAFLSGKNRDLLCVQINPVLQALVDELCKSRSYDYKPGLVLNVVQGANTLVRYDRYLGLAAVAILLAGSAFVVGVAAAPAAAAAVLNVGVADLAVMTASFAGGIPIAHVVDKAVSWMCSKDVVPSKLEAERRYRCHLDFLLDSLGTDSSLLFNCRGQEEALHGFLVSHNFAALAQADKPCPFWLARDEELEEKLQKDSRVKIMFETPLPSVSRPTLRGCQLKAKYAALRFLRQVMCVTAVRSLLSNTTFISFIGESGIGKSALLRALFDLPIKAGLGERNRTRNISVFPLPCAAGTQAPISVLDYPGTTDRREEAAAAFYTTHLMVSMHVILTRAVGGAAATNEVSDTLKGLPVRPTEGVRQEQLKLADKSTLLKPQLASQSQYADLIDKPVCVLVPSLDALALSADPAQAAQEIEAIRADVADRVRVRINQVHLFWNERHWERSPMLDTYLSRKDLVGRGLESVRTFLLEQIMEQLPQFNRHRAEIKAQLGIRDAHEENETG